MDDVVFCFIQTVPCAILRLCCTVCCFSSKRGAQIARRAEAFVFEKKNPLMVGLFFLMHGTGHAIYYPQVFPNLPLGHQVYGLILTTAFWAMYYAACMADPGTVTRATETAMVARYTPDGVMYPPGESMCVTCRVVRPPRSKHCRLCGRCVARFDHHCVWINSDVGSHNTRYFLTFLVLHALLCATCAANGFMELTRWAAANHLWRGYFQYVNASGQTVQVKPSLLLIAQYAIAERPAVVSLCLFTGVVALTMALFAAYHLRLVWRNVTTNESNKMYDTPDADETFYRGTPLANYREVFYPELPAARQHAPIAASAPAAKPAGKKAVEGKKRR